MPTDLEYALMAGRVYQSTRDEINWLPVPDGWNEPLDKRKVLASGFEAGYFQRGTGENKEIVISFAGTGPGLNQDWWANFGLTTGVGAEQLLQAAEYYLEVQALNPKANITITGHSLGGGLSALMGVFFGKKAKGDVIHFKPQNIYMTQQIPKNPSFDGRTDLFMEGVS